MGLVAGKAILLLLLLLLLAFFFARAKVCPSFFSLFSFLLALWSLSLLFLFQNVFRFSLCSQHLFTSLEGTHKKKDKKKIFPLYLGFYKKWISLESFSDSLFLPPAVVSFFPLDVPRHSKEEGENNISNLGIQIVRESALNNNNNNNISKRLARGRLLTNTLEKHVPCFRSHTRYVSFRSRFGRVRSQRARS